MGYTLIMTSILKKDNSTDITEQKFDNELSMYTFLKHVYLDIYLLTKGYNVQIATNEYNICALKREIDLLQKYVDNYFENNEIPEWINIKNIRYSIICDADTQ